MCFIIHAEFNGTENKIQDGKNTRIHFIDPWKQEGKIDNFFDK